MPEVKAEHYTTGELKSAANVCRDASDVLTPTADELMRISGEVELVEEELHFARACRHMIAAALHLKISEKTIQMIARDVGRTYESILARLYLLASVGFLASGIFGLAQLLIPDGIGKHLGWFINWIIHYGMGLGAGVLFSIATIKSRIRRRPRDP